MADKTFVLLEDCTVTTAFDSKYKTSMKPVMGETLKKAIEASGDFTTTNPHPGDKDAKSFTLSVSISITKDDKKKPPMVKVVAEYHLWLTGKGTSGQQAKGSGNGMTTISSRIDDDVKAVVKDVLSDVASKNGKMFTWMRGVL